MNSNEARLSFIERIGLSTIFQSSLVRSISVLVGGTACAQGVMILGLPILTRLYSPDDFSVLAVFVSLLGILSVGACLRFDVAIPIPEDDSDAANLTALALLFGAIFSFVVFLFVSFFSADISSAIGEPKIKSYLWLLPVGVFLASGFSTLQFWATRKKDFNIISVTKMIQAVVGIGSQVIMGLASLTPLGLLFGYLVNSGAGSIGLARKTFKEDKTAIASINLCEMRRLFVEFSRFPKFSTIEALANTGGIQLPIIVISSLAIGPEAGFLMLAMRVIQAPMALVGTAVGQVFLSQAASEYRAGNLGHFSADILGGLVKTGVGPLIFFGTVAPQVFSIVFGEEWYRAGVLVRWMTPWFIMQFLTSPISMALHVTNNQKIAMCLQIFGLILRTGGVVLIGGLVATKVSETYAISGFIFYLVYFIAISSLTKLKWRLFLKRLKNSGPIVLSWTSLALLFFFIASYR